MREQIPGYDIERELGSGGFGQVFAARRRRDGLTVAIKVARRDRSDAAARLRREVGALRAIGAPHVPTLYEVGSLADGTPYLVLEYIAAPTLAQRMAASSAPLGHEEFVLRSCSLLQALAAAHARGFIHRDLKPANIFVLDLPPVAKLCDFGLARTSATEALIERTAPDALVGTVRYMAPEQCHPEGEVDARADLYAVGVILYELLTGRPPFQGSAIEVLEAHRSRRPPPPSRFAPVSPALEAVVLRCLAKDRAVRFASAMALEEALTRALQEGSPATPAMAATAVAPLPQFERLKMGVLLLSTDEDAVQVQRALASFGGQLTHQVASRYAAVFDHALAEDPVRRALQAARALTAREPSARAVVDFAPVVVLPGGERPRGFVSPLFARPLPPLDVAETGRVRLTDAAARVLERAEPDVLAGREEILSPLLAGARAAVEGNATTLATVIGAAGMGKSRLGAELLGRLHAELPGARILSLRAPEPVGSGSGQTLREMVLRALNLKEDLPTEDARALLEERLGAPAAQAHGTGLALLLGWLTPDAGALRGTAAAPGALRGVVARAVAGALRALAARAPLLVLVDDAAHLDETALDAVELATLGEAPAPLWICALSRPALERLRPAWGQRAARHQRVELGPLDPASASALCRRLLAPAEEPPAKVIDGLVARAQGIPLFLVELVRGIKRSGAIRREPRGQAWYLATEELDRLPQTPRIEGWVEREIDALPAELAAHARLASLLGNEVSPLELEGVLEELEREAAGDAFPLDARAGIELLVNAGLMTPGASGRASFRNALIRDVLAASVPLALGQQAHRAAYRCYRDRFAGSEDDRLARMALHAERGGLREEAAGHALALAESLRRRHIYLEAEQAYTHALALLPEDALDRQLAAHRGRGLMRYRGGRFADALEDLSRARELACRLGDLEAEVELLLDEATALDWMDAYHRSRELVERAQERDAGRSPLLRARLQMGLGRSLLRFGEWARSAEVLSEAAAQAERLGDAGYETYVASLCMLGGILPALGRLDEAQAVLDRSVAICRERGDRLHLSSAIGNRVLLSVARRDAAQALRDTLDAMEISRELGMMRDLCRAQLNVAELHYQAGDVEGAWPHLRQASAMLARIEGEAGRPVARLLEARLRAYLGEREAARAMVEELRDSQRRAREAGATGALFLPPDEVLLRLVDLATRDATDAEWDALQADADRVAYQWDPLEVMELRGLTMLRVGREREGRRRLEEAVAAAARIPNLIEGRIRRALQAIPE